MAPVRLVCIDFRAVTKRSEKFENMSFGFNGVDHVRSFPKMSKQLPLANLCVHGTSSASFHRLLCINETVRNAPKLESWVQWSGSGAFVTKNSETPQNMSFGSNGVDRVRSLREIPMRPCLANMYDNGTSSASFASTLVQYLNCPKRHKT
jgi:hypothetical protein